MAVKDFLTPIQLKTLLETQNLITIAKKYNVSKQYISQLYAEYKEQYPELFAEPVISAKWLAEQLEAHTILEICNMTGKSYHHIKKLMDEYGLIKPTTTAAFDKEHIRKAYVDECRSDKEIAKFYGCSVSLVKKFRYEHSIFKTDRKPLSMRLTKEEAIRLVQQGSTVSQLSELFDATPNEIRKLLLNYGIGF